MRIVFMGTPDFAVASLAILVENGYDIVGVITAPDKPAGRGRQLSESPVKKYAVEKGLRVLQPTNLKNEAFLEELRSLKAELQIVVAFRMLPEVVWNMPPIGTFNLHASLLPDYRGAAPINWAIINGEKESGVTTFFLQHAIDTGSIILQEKVPISDTDTAGTLHDKLMETGAGLVLKTVQAIESGSYKAKEQDLSGDYPHAPKIFKEDCRIKWEQGTDKIYNFIRGLSPYPAAWTELDGKVFKIYLAKKELNNTAQKAGSLETDGKSTLRIATADGFIIPTEVQIEGKRRMSTEEFLRGYTIQAKKVD